MTARIFYALILTLISVCAFGQDQGSIISEIVVTGNKSVSTEAILTRIRTKVGQPYVQAQLDQDKATLEQLGFFKAVDVRATPLEGNKYRINIEVSEFDVVKEIRIVGNSVIDTDKILKVVTIKIGQPFNLGEQKPTGDAIAKLYNDRGFFALVSEIGPLDDSPGTVSIVIQEMKVNSVGVTGNTRTKDRVMKRLIRTKPGEAFNIKKWDDDLRRMMGTQWFDKVVPVEKQSDEGFGMDLTAEVKEARTGNFVVGVSVDPRSSFAGQIKLFESNFKGTGQTVGVSYLQAISGGGGSVDLDYVNPFIDKYNTSMSVSLYDHLLYRFANTGFGGGSSTPTDSTYTERRIGATLAFQREVRNRDSISYGLKFERVDTSDVNLDPNTAFIKQDGDLAELALGYNRNHRDLDLDPSRGDWLNIQSEPGYSRITSVGGIFSDPSLLGSSFFVRNSIEYRSYHTNQPPRGRQLDAPRRVLAFRLKMGAISGTVPFFEQFFAGGSDTVRGYQDDRFWGKQTLLSTVEYRHPLMKAFSGILFVDYGGAWGGYGDVNDFTQSDKIKLHLGYGVGVSFKTPLGPIRLDFAWNERGGSRTHFLIGTSF